MAVDATIALVSLANAKAFIGIADATTSEDSIVESLIDSVSKLLAGYCGRKFISAEYTEYHDGDDTTSLVLNQFPVTELESLHIDPLRDFDSPSEVDADENVILDAESGIIKLWNNYGLFPTGKGNIKVVYTAGYASASVPADLSYAAKLTVLQYYKRHYQDKRIGLSSETVGDRTFTYANDDIPKAAKTILNNYKRSGAGGYGYTS